MSKRKNKAESEVPSLSLGPTPFKWLSLDKNTDAEIETIAANVPGGVLIVAASATFGWAMQFVPMVAAVQVGERARLVSAVDGFLGQAADSFVNLRDRLEGGMR